MRWFIETVASRYDDDISLTRHLRATSDLLATADAQPVATLITALRVADCSYEPLAILAHNFTMPIETAYAARLWPTGSRISTIRRSFAMLIGPFRVAKFYRMPPSAPQCRFHFAKEIRTHYFIESQFSRLGDE